MEASVSSAAGTKATVKSADIIIIISFVTSIPVRRSANAKQPSMWKKSVRGSSDSSTSMPPTWGMSWSTVDDSAVGDFRADSRSQAGDIGSKDACCSPSRHHTNLESALILLK